MLERKQPGNVAIKLSSIFSDGDEDYSKISVKCDAYDESKIITKALLEERKDELFSDYSATYQSKSRWTYIQQIKVGEIIGLTRDLPENEVRYEFVRYIMKKMKLTIKENLNHLHDIDQQKERAKVILDQETVKNAKLERNILQKNLDEVNQDIENMRSYFYQGYEKLKPIDDIFRKVRIRRPDLNLTKVNTDTFIQYYQEVYKDSTKSSALHVNPKPTQFSEASFFSPSNSPTRLKSSQVLRYCTDQGIEGFKKIEGDGNCFFRAVLSACGKNED